MDYEERITAAELGQGEERSEMTLRPQKLEDYIGQKKAKSGTDDRWCQWFSVLG